METRFARLDRIIGPLDASGWTRIDEDHDAGQAGAYSVAYTLDRAGVTVSVALRGDGRIDLYRIDREWPEDSEPQPRIYSGKEAGAVEVFRALGWLDRPQPRSGGAAWSTDLFGSAAPPPVLIHVPHASTRIPPDVAAELLLDVHGRITELKDMTDWYTDDLAYAAARAAQVPVAVFANRLSRFVVDPERLPDDAEPMAAIGMGAVYRVTSGLQPLRHADADRDAALVARYQRPYADAFADLVDAALAARGEVVIIDLHSYPREALPYERDHRAARPGVCLGADEFHTPPQLVDLARAAFADQPGGVALNTPFAGMYVPLRHLGLDRRVRSIMVDIRRDTYLDDDEPTLRFEFVDVVEDIASLLRSLASRN